MDLFLIKCCGNLLNGFLRYDDALIEADLMGISPYDTETDIKTEIKEIINRL